VSAETRREEPRIRIAGICGSLRQGSYTRMAVRKALEGAAEIGVQTQLIDLRDYDLVFNDGNQDESKYPPGVFRLREDVKRADGSSSAPRSITAG
jgi:NAD(P)H-dependent FMN reductase